MLHYISHCVLQGSILGSLLFLIYINDLPNVKLYADETSVLIPVHDIIRDVNYIQSCLDLISHWFCINRLVLNISISHIMLFSLIKHIDYPIITINNVTVDYVNSVKFLGCYIDDKLKWDVHKYSMCVRILVEVLQCYVLDSRCFLNPSKL